MFRSSTEKTNELPPLPKNPTKLKEKIELSLFPTPIIRIEVVIKLSMTMKGNSPNFGYNSKYCVHFTKIYEYDYLVILFCVVVEKE